jgi:hypothetical protein
MTRREPQEDDTAVPLLGTASKRVNATLIPRPLPMLRHVTAVTVLLEKEDPRCGDLPGR